MECRNFVLEALRSLHRWRYALLARIERYEKVQNIRVVFNEMRLLLMEALLAALSSFFLRKRKWQSLSSLSSPQRAACVDASCNGFICGPGTPQLSATQNVAARA